MTESSDRVVVPYEVFVERRERRRPVKLASPESEPAVVAETVEEVPTAVVPPVPAVEPSKPELLGGEPLWLPDGTRC